MPCEKGLLNFAALPALAVGTPGQEFQLAFVGNVGQYKVKKPVYTQVDSSRSSYAGTRVPGYSGDALVCSLRVRVLKIALEFVQSWPASRVPATRGPGDPDLRGRKTRNGEG
eukprot:2705210-Rhodomonas_salina.1